MLPTGRYDANPGPDIGYGNFYTFRPGIQVDYLPKHDLALSAKLTWGPNTGNRDNDLRSGNWIGLDNALAYKTAIGAFGLHTVLVHQYQSDSNNAWGTSRYRTFNGGAFFTTKVPVLDAALTIQYMRTVGSRNAKAGDFTQVRLIQTVLTKTTQASAPARVKGCHFLVIRCSAPGLGHDPRLFRVARTRSPAAPAPWPRRVAALGAGH
ncbi:hypothetical protein CBM2592_B100362 [Cupriavidus taiwanensis]|nr:hypothetical protein CBM2592_B100362 [Cupriavidus taiwanensis]SOY63075.1 hypothetical protein CBM2588_B130025 [Cupriavidus taiwanensis]SOY98149.1 hypothetical protein CBM2591_B80364 [Cupriavidus taiwanensis]SOZ77191.1 hypothetical protein CBM2617_U10020 [Cupriavidus taiwanensis]SOZ85201.1 hypothetical protein CBM2618_B130040 [Cupriavidus taiwanensis]